MTDPTDTATPASTAPKERSPRQQALDAAIETLTVMFFPGHEFSTLSPKQKADVMQAVRVMRGGPMNLPKNKKWDDNNAVPPPTPDEIHTRAAEYRLRWPDEGTFTLRALATHWDELVARVDTITLADDPIIDALINVFRLDRPAENRWPIPIAQRLRNAAGIIATTEGVTESEIERRAGEFRRRFPRRDFTIDALADRWFELAAPLERVAADKTVSNFKDWAPNYPHVDLFDDQPAVQDDQGGEFDLYRWHQNQIRAQTRDIAFKMLEGTRPHWAVGATPQSLAKADPPYEPGLLTALKGWVRAPGPFLILYGPTGTGKTFIACAIAYRFADNGTIPLFLRYSDLMTQIRSEWNRNSDEASIMKRATEVGLLILDELGATGEIRDWELNYFDTLLNNRLDRGRPTIITTNLMASGDGTAADLEAHVGKRFASRFMLGTVLGVGGLDRRRP